MANYKVVDSDALDADLTSLSDTIRAKTGGTAKLSFPDGMKSAVSGIDTSTTPEITVSAAGLITAKSGSKSATKQLTTQAAKEITPGTTDQAAVASGVYTTGVVTVKGDANLLSENIVKGKSIFGVDGAAAASGGYETCSVTVNAKNLNGYWNVQYMRLNDDGTIDNWGVELDFSKTSVTINAVKGFYVHVWGQYVTEWNISPATAGDSLTIDTRAYNEYGRSFLIYETAPDTATISMNFD